MIGLDYFSDAPWNEPDLSHLFECESCHRVLNVFESGDPCMIDREPFCDKCASDIMQLRFDELIGKVSDKTKNLVNDHFYQKIWEQEYDKLPGRVKHI